MRKHHQLREFRYHASLFEFRLYGLKKKASAQFARERSIVRYAIDPVITAGSFLPQLANVHDQFSKQELSTITPEALAKRLPQKDTHAVIVHDVNRSNIDGMRKLLQHCAGSLEELEIKSITPNFDQSELAESIRGCGKLKVLSIGYLSEKSGAAVRSLVKLQSLEVMHTRMDSERFAFLAKSSSCHTLKCLSVRDPLDSSALQSLVQHASAFQHLTELRLDQGGNGFDPEHAPYFVKLLSSLPGLESLTVSGCDRACASDIARSVGAGGNIKFLKFNLSRVEAQDSAEALVALQSCLRLESLVLDWAIDESGMKALCTLLTANGGCLRHLELDLTHVPPASVLMLAQALQVNHTLHTLTLTEETGLKGLATAKALGLAIGANITLRKVVISCAAHIGEYIKDAAGSTTLRELDISNSPEDLAAEKAFCAALKANPNLQLMEIGFASTGTSVYRLAIEDLLSLNRRGKSTSATGILSS